MTKIPTEATPWDGKGGGEGGVRIRGRTFMILERPTSISRSQVGGGGEAGTQRYKLTSTSVDKGLHPRVGMGSGGGGTPIEFA